MFRDIWTRNAIRMRTLFGFLISRVESLGVFCFYRIEKKKILSLKKSAAAIFYAQHCLNRTKKKDRISRSL